MKFIHLSTEKFEKFKTPTNLGQSFKPNGTLWFACSDAWKEYLKDIDADDWLQKYRHTYEAKLDLDKLVVLKTKKDIELFTEKFALSESYDSINWNQVRKESGKSGIYIVNPSIKTARYTYSWYSSFDICSVAIWNKNAILELHEVD